ncbi:MAG TPA: helix-turn-helix domain-containing protein [Nitrososphaera sp.]|nr:helix-turn-helix domain-containing protein [Nitrososphaera sp.]
MEEMQDQMDDNNPRLLASLQSLGLTNYESKAYLALLSLGTCDARQLCVQSGVPSSKIYTILEKFELLRLVEVQQSKPVKFKALEPSLGVDRLVKNKEREILSIKDTLPLLETELDNIFSKRSDKGRSGGEEPFFNLQFGMKNHVQKHLPYLADSRVETLSYFETTCLMGAKVYGHSVKRDIINNIQRNNISSKVIFGTEDKMLVEGFLKGLPDSANIEFKITKQIHAPFHVLDKKSVIVVVDNPLFKEGRIASIHAIGRSLAKELHEGYRSLWDSAGGL